MFGQKAKATAAKWKGSEPKVDDVKVDAVDTGESFREKTGKVDVSEVDEPKTRGEAFKAARANGQKQFEWPPGSGNMYHTRTAEEDKKPASSGTKPSAGSTGYKRAGTTPGGQPIRQTIMPQQTGADMKRKHDELVAKERAAMASRPKMPAPRVEVAPDAATRTFPGQRGTFRSSRTYGGSDQRGAPMTPPRSQVMDDYNRTVAEAALKDARQKQLMQQMGAGEDMAYAKGGAVESKKMMKKELSFMKKKGAPKSMIKHEEAEAKGMKRGGMACGGGMKKYARGGGVESHGKTKGTMIKMASGGSVSARADGVAQRGKTNCKIC